MVSQYIFYTTRRNIPLLYLKIHNTLWHAFKSKTISWSYQWDTDTWNFLQENYLTICWQANTQGITSKEHGKLNWIFKPITSPSSFILCPYTVKNNNQNPFHSTWPFPIKHIEAFVSHSRHDCKNACCSFFLWKYCVGVW